jgi:methylamine dehydrogenase accessory protein MauD
MTIVVSNILLWILVLFQSLVLIGLVRAVHLLQMRSSSGAGASSAVARPSIVGKQAPDFDVSDVNGGAINLSAFSERVVALLFVSPSCRSCGWTLADMSALGERARENLVVICRADENACRELGETYHLLPSLVVDEDLELSRLFDVDAVPTAVVIDESGKVRSYGHPMRTAELIDLMDVGKPHASLADVGERR